MATIVLQGTVPNPTILLAIQAGGGVLALLPIASLKKFAKLTDSLHKALVAAALANVVISFVVLIGFVGESQYLMALINKIGQIGVCRALIFYDILMLGGLVCLTGGSDKSAFAPQFAAILPMAMLIPDSANAKWAYAAVFLLMFLAGLQGVDSFKEYLPDNRIKARWLLVFFFIFILFPVVYSIQTERTTP